MRAPLLALLLTAAPLAAQDLAQSPRPPANPVYLVAAPAVSPAVAAKADAVPAGAMDASLRPQPRPAKIAVAKVAERPPAPNLLTIRPEPRPEQDLLAAAAAAPKPDKKAERKKKKEAASRKGSVCGVNAIKGEEIAPIVSKVNGCGVKDGVKVTSVSGVRLSQGATIDCVTATALNTWVDKVLQPSFNDQVVELQIAGHYICRSRNNVKGAKVSEHGRGKAIDISAVRLADGKVLDVAKNFKALRRAHKGACGIFNTTLGPGSDGYHEDHMHFDTATGRGPYCR